MPKELRLRTTPFKARGEGNEQVFGKQRPYGKRLSEGLFLFKRSGSGGEVSEVITHGAEILFAGMLGHHGPKEHIDVEFC